MFDLEQDGKEEHLHSQQSCDNCAHLSSRVNELQNANSALEEHNQYLIHQFSILSRSMQSNVEHINSKILSHHSNTPTTRSNPHPPPPPGNPSAGSPLLEVNLGGWEAYSVADLAALISSVPLRTQVFNYHAFYLYFC